MPQKHMECFRLLLEDLAWIEHQFLSGIRDSRKAGSLWGMMRGVGGVKKSIYQSWLAKRLRLGLGLLCWGFKGVQEEIPSEEASTLQIRSVAFPPGQYTSPQLHPWMPLSYGLEPHLSKKLSKITSTPSLSQPIWPRWVSRQFVSPPSSPDFAPCDFCLFPKLRGCRYETIEEMKEAVTKVIDTLTQEDVHGAF